MMSAQQTKTQPDFTVHETDRLIKFLFDEYMPKHRCLFNFPGNNLARELHLTPSDGWLAKYKNEGMNLYFNVLTSSFRFPENSATVQLSQTSRIAKLPEIAVIMGEPLTYKHLGASELYYADFMYSVRYYVVDLNTDEIFAWCSLSGGTNENT